MNTCSSKQNKLRNKQGDKQQKYNGQRPIDARSINHKEFVCSQTYFQNSKKYDTYFTKL